MRTYLMCIWSISRDARGDIAASNGSTSLTCRQHQRSYQSARYLSMRVTHFSTTKGQKDKQSSCLQHTPNRVSRT